MNTPKTRGLKEFLISLKLFNNNDFIDGKKVELSHILPKWLQKKFSNHKGLMKYWVSIKCFRILTLLYVMNGGKWGPNWAYSLGTRGLELKDPQDNTKPHPFIAKWIIPKPMEYFCKIKVIKRYAEKNVSARYWRNLIYNCQFNFFLQKIQTYFDDGVVDFRLLQTSDRWNMRKVLSFRFYDSYKSFAMNFNNDEMKVLVRMKSNHVMEFKDIIEVTHDDASVCMMYGKYWPIYESTSSDDFCNDYHKSMDYIKLSDAKFGWNFMTNIAEPILLIHDCVGLTNKLKRSLPQECKPQNQYAWTQHLMFYSNRVQEYIVENPQVNVTAPCGPRYICKEHSRCSCVQCTIHKGKYPSRKWKIEWCCNVRHVKKMYVFDSKSGLVWTNMKSVPREH